MKFWRNICFMLLLLPLSSCGSVGSLVGTVITAPIRIIGAAAYDEGAENNIENVDIDQATSISGSF